MSVGYRFAKFAGCIVFCLAVSLSLGSIPASADTAHTQRKTAAKKGPAQPQLPPLPSGPTGPVPQIPLDSIAPVAPQVTYQNGQLTIVANNSTLSDILRAVRKQTGAEIEIPAATDRVVTHLGPGPARDVMSELLNGSRFNYVLLGSPENTGTLTRVVLVAKTAGGAPENVAANNPPQQVANAAAGVEAQDATDTGDADAADSAEETPDQPAEAEQPAAPATDQQEAKTPQQMLQEMQQRQLQLQQQQPQQNGQPPTPGLPGRPNLQPQQQPQQDQ